MTERYDVIIVGTGPAGIFTALELAEQAPDTKVLLVDERFQTPVEGLYAIGDGAGITRGLMQASVTGVVVARDILGLPL